MPLIKGKPRHCVRVKTLRFNEPTIFSRQVVLIPRNPFQNSVFQNVDPISRSRLYPCEIRSHVTRMIVERQAREVSRVTTTGKCVCVGYITKPLETSNSISFCQNIYSIVCRDLCRHAWFIGSVSVVTWEVFISVGVCVSNP